MLTWSNSYLPANRAKNTNNGGNNGKKDIDNKRRTEKKQSSFRDYDREFKFDNEETTKSQQLEDAEDCLDAFIEDYMVVAEEGGNRLTKIINGSFWDACSVITHYYDGKYKPILGKMNKVLDIMSTQKFSNALKIVCSDEDIKGWSRIWKSVWFTISVALITTYGAMKEETISTYLSLLTNSGIAGKDIDMLVDDYAITKDLAVDLIIGIPVIPDDMNDVAINEFHDKFILKLLDNADENIDVLDAGTQFKLFKFFFGDDRTGLKCIGRMLSDTRISKFKNDSQQEIYDEYVSMLTAALESRDIKDIKFVLKYVLEQKKDRPRDEVVYDMIKISQYDSIRKALFELLGEHPEYKKVIAS